MFVILQDAILKSLLIVGLRLVGCSSSLVIRTIGSFSNNCGISVQVKYLIIDVFSVRKALGLPSKKPKIASGGSGQIPNFFVILCP